VRDASPASSSSRRALIALALAVAAPAAAEPVERPQPQLRWSRDSQPAAAAVSSRIIYVHKCPVQGCTIRPGTNDSRTDTSDIPSQQVVITQFRQSQAVWDQMMACVKNTYAPFNITVTDVDPGNVPHYENIVGGMSGTELSPDLGGAGGVSPFTCAEIPNSVSFTFDVYGPAPDQLCWTVAQETAHSFGLEHEYNANDPLTYIAGGPSMKRFQATDSPCGTFQKLAKCQCTNLATQNSYKFIVDMFGAGAATPPTISIKAPASGNKVQPGFVVRVSAMDDVAVDHVELWIDNMDTGVKAMTAPYILTAPDGIAEGPHTIEARAIDVQGVPASAMVDVELGPPCTTSSGCSGDDVCVMGVCLPGRDVPGGIGDTCTAPTECLFGSCVGPDPKSMQCVAACDVDVKGACPSDYDCLPNGATGACYYEGSAGCCSAGSNPSGPLLLGTAVLGLYAFGGRRRRQRR
jgi:MYXO-CTERM domain-containing protein